MAWLEIMATSHPFILGMILISVFGIILSAIKSCIHDDDVLAYTIVVLAILWFFAGIGYVFVG